MKDDRVTIMAGQPKGVIASRLEVDAIAAIRNAAMVEGVTPSRMMRELIREGMKVLGIAPEPAR